MKTVQQFGERYCELCAAYKDKACDLYRAKYNGFCPESEAAKFVYRECLEEMKKEEQ